jgi:DNA-binding transcriptional LysR family regulator
MERDGAETEMWRFAPKTGRPVRPVMVRPRLIVNSAGAAVDSAIAGHGITRVMSYQAAAAVAAGKLRVLLRQHEPAPIPVYLVLPPGRSATPKQKAFVAFAAAPLRKALAAASRQIDGSTGQRLRSSRAAR